MSQLVRTIGKSRITISVEGCVDCGIAYSPAWTEERRHQIVIGDRRDYITLKRCTGCSAKAGRPVQYEAPTALMRRKSEAGVQKSEPAMSGMERRFATVR